MHTLQSFLLGRVCIAVVISKEFVEAVKWLSYCSYRSDSRNCNYICETVLVSGEGATRAVGCFERAISCR